MSKEFLKKKTDNWQRLYDALYDQPFDILKEEVQRTEEQIRNVVGADADYLKIPDTDDQKEELELLLDQRRTLLNWTYQESSNSQHLTQQHYVFVPLCAELLLLDYQKAVRKRHHIAFASSPSF